MDTEHMGSWDMGIGWVIMVLFWGAVIFGILYILKSNSKLSSDKPAEKTAMEILKTRYALGEIDKQEYEQKKREIEE